MGPEDEEDEQQQQEPMRIETLNSSGAFEDPQSVPTLLPEIVIEILLRLPVESLLRCRSVCKSWRSMISDPHFVKSHLCLSTSNNHYAHHRLIFSTVSRRNLKSCPLYDVLYDKSVNALELDYPLKQPYNSISIACSCNGLLCIAIDQDGTFILNPSTRRSNRLPYSFFKRVGWYLVYGLGYDESTDDYKLVVMSCCLRNRAAKVKIYSVKSGNWKKIGDFPHGIPLDNNGKFSNGALHWAASSDFGSWTIVSFDLAKETYGEVLQPVYDEGDKYLTLGVLGEWLCVICNYRGNRVDVWVMKVYGVKDSWTKLVSIPDERVRDLVPLCIANDGKVLLQFGSKLVLYDAKNGSSSEIQNFEGCFQAYNLVESMVSPDAPSRP